MKNKRRDFLKTACAPIAFSMFGISLIEACSKEEYGGTTNDNTANNDDDNSSSDEVTVDLTNSNFSGLSSVGGWMNYTEQNMLLLRISNSQIRAFSNVCPHQGTQNRWSYNNSKFTCAQHNNSYDDNCSGGLSCYTTSINGDTLTITR